MKKCLVLLAALALTGCTAHARFKTSYLQKYVDYDCGALKAERTSVARENARIRRNQLPAIHGTARRGVWIYYMEPPPRKGQISYHEKRMRNQARLQAILRMESSQGCGSRQDASAHNAPRRQ